jgi:hypothetical protein
LRQRALGIREKVRISVRHKPQIKRDSSLRRLRSE